MSPLTKAQAELQAQSRLVEEQQHLIAAAGAELKRQRGQVEAGVQAPGEEGSLGRGGRH